jgi:serine/threonine-protein kinase ATR
LAAQIVQNQTRPATSQQPSGETPIREQLQAILYNQATVQETNVQTNAQLVSVLLQAGLVPLTAANLFTDDDVLLSLAMDSMSVIEATVQRQPEVLLEELTPDGPQLLLSLLTALIAISGRSKFEKLPVRRLLESAITALHSSINFWPQARVLQEIIQECVDGTWVAFPVSGLLLISFLQNFFSLSRISQRPMQRLAPICLPRGVWPSFGRSRKIPLLCRRGIPPL